MNMFDMTLRLYVDLSSFLIIIIVSFSTKIRHLRPVRGLIRLVLPKQNARRYI